MKGLTAVSVGILLLSAPVAGAQTTQPPLTMGQLAMLRAHPDESLVPSLRAALASSDPGLRAVAARIVGIGRIQGLAGDVVSALEREQDGSVGEEVLRAALFYNTAESVAAAESYLPRSEADGLRAYAVHLARTSPGRLAAALPTLATRFRHTGRDASALAAIVAMCGEQHNEARDQVFRAWMAVASGDEWRTLLDVANQRSADAAALLVDAMDSANPAIREATVWHIDEWLVSKIDLPQAAIDRAARPGATGPADTWEAYGHEIAARLTGRPAALDGAAILTGNAPTHASDAVMLSHARVLSKSEARALAAAIGDTLKRSGSAEQASAVNAVHRTWVAKMRSVEALWPGFLGSLLDAAGCARTASPTFGALLITYRQDGRPGNSSIDGGLLPPPCQDALNALANVTLLESGAAVDESVTQQVVLSTQKSIVACIDAPPDRSLPDPDAVRRIVDPRRRSMVKPIYPPKEYQEGREGLVVMDAVIARSGCIRSVRVVRSPSPALDLAAVAAVQQWEYTPATIDKQSVDVVMTVTVNFTIH